jgi:tetratricopeptide (TPR) repeat protein
MDPLKLWKFLSERWERRYTPLILILLLLLILLPMAASVKFSSIDLAWWVIMVIACVAVFAIWWLSTRLPKVPKGKVGFVVAISHEDPTEQTTFRNDFVRVLNELLQASNLRYKIKFIELNRFHATKILDTETANRYLRKTKGHFLLYGQVKDRTLDEKTHHFLSLNGIVTHSPIPLPVSQSFSVEMSSLLPRKLQIAKEGDVFAFEFTAKLTDLISRYIIGVASLLSSDYQYAIELFENVREQLNRSDDRIPPIATLKVRIPVRLEESYQFEIDRLYSTWVSMRDRELIKRMRPWVDKLQMLRPDDYAAHLYAAICAFLLDRDLKRAKREVKQCRGAKDRTWYYSKAFLHAYEGKMRQAISDYQAVFAVPSKNLTVPLQTEQFIIDVLSVEPGKVQLHYCLGLINYHAKADFMAARRDFSNFLSVCPRDRFAQERAEAADYVAKIDARRVQPTTQ